MARLIAILEKALGADWIQNTDWLRNQNTVAAIETRLLAGDVAGLVAEVEAAALKFAADTNRAYVTAGEKAAKWLDAKVDDALVRFDVTNDRAVLRARSNQYELVRGFTQEQREITRQVVGDGMRRGVNPREMARDLRGSIGLTPSQSEHVASYRRALEAGDYANALGRELRDARSDRTLQLLARDHGTLPPDRVDALVARYERNYVSYRAEVIARTEALRAAHAGTQDLFTQAIGRGDIDAAQLTKEWNAGPNTRHARADHQEMERREPIPVLEDFVLPDGTRMKHPGDPRGGAKHNAQCRCSSSVRYAA